MWNYNKHLITWMILLSHTLLSCFNSSKEIKSNTSPERPTKNTSEQQNTTKPTSLAFTTTDGQAIDLICSQGTWHARIKQGVAQKQIQVVFAPGCTLQELINSQPQEHKFLLHIVANSNKATHPSYVYVEKNAASVAEPQQVQKKPPILWPSPKATNHGEGIRLNQPVFQQNNTPPDVKLEQRPLDNTSTTTGSKRPPTKVQTIAKMPATPQDAVSVEGPQTSEIAQANSESEVAEGKQESEVAAVTPESEVAEGKQESELAAEAIEKAAYQALTDSLHQVKNINKLIDSNQRQLQALLNSIISKGQTPALLGEAKAFRDYLVETGRTLRFQHKARFDLYLGPRTSDYINQRMLQGLSEIEILDKSIGNTKETLSIICDACQFDLPDINADDPVNRKALLEPLRNTESLLKIINKILENQVPGGKLIQLVLGIEKPQTWEEYLPIAIKTALDFLPRGKVTLFYNLISGKSTIKELKKLIINQAKKKSKELDKANKEKKAREAKQNDTSSP